MEHRGVRYEIKRAIGKNQWVWIVHSSPRPRQGSIEGTRQAAILAAERTINIWWQRRHGRDAVRVAEFNRRPRNPTPAHEENLRTARAPLRRFVLLVRHQLPYPPACVESQVRESVGRRSAAGTIARPSSSGKPCCDSSHGARNDQAERAQERGPQRGKSGARLMVRGPRQCAFRGVEFCFTSRTSSNSIVGCPA